MGYEPTIKQVLRCQQCKWWLSLSNTDTGYACLYLYYNGKRRGPDPCDKWEPRNATKSKRKVKPTLVRKDSRNDKN